MGARKAVVKRASMATRSRAKKRRLTEKEFQQRVKIFGLIVLVGGGAAITYKIWKDREDQREIRDRDKYQINGHNLQQVAIEVYDAFFKQDIFGATECEQCAIDAIKDVPKQYIQQVALLYNKKYGRNLYEDFRNFLNEPQYAKVDHLLN